MKAINNKLLEQLYPQERFALSWNHFLAGELDESDRVLSTRGGKTHFEKWEQLSETIQCYHTYYQLPSQYILSLIHI